MDDEEFKTAVLARLESIEQKIGRGGALARAIDEVAENTQRQFEHMDRRLDAVASRLDEQDLVADRMMQKLDRLATHVSTAAQASEQALDAVTMLSRRVHKLEHPDEQSGPAGGATPPR